MRDYSYIVGIDANGQVYLAHARFGNNRKGSQKKDHKYFQRIADKGKYLYFYSKDEWNNYLNQRKADKDMNNALKRMKKIKKRVLSDAENNGNFSLVNRNRSWKKDSEYKLASKDFEDAMKRYDKASRDSYENTNKLFNWLAADKKRRDRERKISKVKKEFHKAVNDPVQYIKKNLKKTMKELNKAFDLIDSPDKLEKYIEKKEFERELRELFSY